MRRPSFKVATVALAVVGISGLVVGTAEAHSYKAVQIKVCNDSPVQQTFRVSGYNQGKHWSTSGWQTVGANGACTVITNWWWKINETVTIEHSGAGQALTDYPKIPNDKKSNGETWTTSFNSYN